MSSKIPAKILKFLDSEKIRYEIVNHRTVYTAYDKAATLRVKPNVIGKTLVMKTGPSTKLRAGNDLAIVLIPGNKNLDKNKFKKIAKAKQVGFISEKVMKNKFKGIKIGALPPFGEIWKLQTFMDRGLMKEKNIFVNSGIYEASLKLSPKVFEKLGAILGNFSRSKS